MKSSPLIRRVEEYTLGVTVIASILISLLDLLGMLDSIPFLGSRIPSITLLVASLILSNLVVERKTNLEYIQDMLLDIGVERFRTLQNRIDPELDKIFGDHIREMIQNVRLASKERKLFLKDIELFRYFYQRTLEAFPKATFLATSIPSHTYFWRNRQVEDAIAIFIKKGGKMKRIFYIDTSLDNLGSEEREIIYTQIEMGVEVYVTYAPEVPQKLRRFFLVESKGKIAWEAHIGPSKEIVDVEVTSDTSRTKEYLTMINNILELPQTRRYLGKDAG